MLRGCIAVGRTNRLNITRLHQNKSLCKFVNHYNVKTSVEYFKVKIWSYIVEKQVTDIGLCPQDLSEVKKIIIIERFGDNFMW